MLTVTRQRTRQLRLEFLPLGGFVLNTQTRERLEQSIRNWARSSLKPGSRQVSKGRVTGNKQGKEAELSQGYIARCQITWQIVVEQETGLTRAQYISFPCIVMLTTLLANPESCLTLYFWQVHHKLILILKDIFYHHMLLLYFLQNL